MIWRLTGVENADVLVFRDFLSKVISVDFVRHYSALDGLGILVSLSNYDRDPSVLVSLEDLTEGDVLRLSTASPLHGAHVNDYELSPYELLLRLRSAFFTAP